MTLDLIYDIFMVIIKIIEFYNLEDINMFLTIGVLRSLGPFNKLKIVLLFYCVNICNLEELSCLPWNYHKFSENP